MPVKCTCDEYQCPCHDWLAAVLADDKRLPTRHQLALDLLALLDLQQRYFKYRDKETLGRCKEAERKIKSVCDNILHPQPPAPPRLFPEPPSEGATPDGGRGKRG